jgi:hypothetical protein
MTQDKNDFPAVRTSATDGQFGKAVDPESKTGNFRKVNQSIAEALRLISEGIQHLKTGLSEPEVHDRWPIGGRYRRDNRGTRRGVAYS